MTAYEYICLLYRLSTPALTLMLTAEGDEMRKELITAEIEARQ